MCVLSYTCRIFPLTSVGACVGFKVDEMRRRCDVQAQNAPSIEDIMFDACHPRLSWIDGEKSRKAFHIEKVKFVYIKLKWNAQVKGIVLIGFPFCRSHVVC